LVDGEGRIGGSFHERSRTFGRNIERLLVAQRGYEKTEGSDFRRRIEPESVAAGSDASDDVVEGRGTRHFRIECALRTDEHRVRAQARSGGERGEQSVLVERIGVAVF
jgi:hypothetical protein